MDEEAKFLDRIPLRAKKKGVAAADENRGEYQHVEKNLKTAAAEVHNNNSLAVLAAALSRAQLLALVADLSSAGAGGGAGRCCRVLTSPASHTTSTTSTGPSPPSEGLALNLYYFLQPPEHGPPRLQPGQGSPVRLQKSSGRGPRPVGRQ